MIEEEKRNKQQEARDAYARLTPDEKFKRIESGLYNFPWLSYPEEDHLGRS